MDLNEKKVCVIGAGISGIASVSLLAKVGAKPFLYDGNENLNKEELRKKLPESIQKKIEIETGRMSEEKKKETELIVISPGVSQELPVVCELKEKGIPVWGEIELAYRCAKGRIAAITGTNGKTTTTSLTGEIMRSFFQSVFVVGNIGTPYTETALQTEEDSVTVAEISSFQLETTELFHPEVSAILNITPDHLDRHHTMENYIQVKKSITKRQKPEEVCVLNYDDPITRRIGEELSNKVFYFSRTNLLEEGICLEGDTIIYKTKEEVLPVCRIDEMQLLGTHNIENVMAAAAIGISMKVPLVRIRETIRNFKAVEHRIEYVTEKKNVKYYNDSKGTNPDAAIKGIQAMVRPTVLIGGGYDKESSYEEWIQAFAGKVRFLILLGQTREKIAEAAKRCGFFNIIFAEDLKEAVEVASEKALPGDAVLLSPACASWGMFKNYEERGRMFKEYVNNLEE